MKKQLLVYTAVLTLAIAVMLTPAPPAVEAGGRTCGSCYTPTYYPTTEYVYVDRILPVAYPVPFTVGVPVISYNWNGGFGIPGYSPVYAAQPAAPGVPVQQPPMQPQPQPQPQSQAQPQAATPNTSALFQLTDAEIDFLIDRIEKRLAARTGNNVATAPPVQRPSTSPPPAVPQEPSSGKVYSDADVIRVLTAKNGQNSCYNCHSGTTFKGGIKIFDGPGKLSGNVAWARVWDAADAGRMPKEAQTNKQAIMSDADVDVLRWKMLGR